MKIIEFKRAFNIYQNDKLLRRGIERELEIIGEAVNKLLKIDPTLKMDAIIVKDFNEPPDIFS